MKNDPPSIRHSGCCMKQFYEVRFGNFSCYVLADDEDQAGENVDGMLESLYRGGEVYVTGHVVEKTVDSIDTAVADMIRGSKGLH